MDQQREYLLSQRDRHRRIADHFDQLLKLLEQEDQTAVTPPGGNGASAPEHRGGPGRSGLRSRIKQVLREQGRSLRPREVAERLTDLPESKTPIGPRVATEMSRMAKTRKLLKTKAGYSLPKD